MRGHMESNERINSDNMISRTAITGYAESNYTEKFIEAYIKLSTTPSNINGIGLVKKYLESINLLPKHKFLEKDLEDAIRLNFFAEFDTLSKKEHAPDTFDGSRKILFEAISCLALDESTMTREEIGSISGRIKRAGMHMFQVDGMRGLQDSFIWGFVPIQWFRIVDVCFHGIGDWIAFEGISRNL